MDMDHPHVHVFGNAVAPMVDNGDPSKIDEKGDPSDIEKASIITSGGKGEQEALEAALESTRKGTVVFFDEIHIIGKAHQDSFYPYIEDDTITFIDATILLSRVPAVSHRGLPTANILPIMKIVRAGNTHCSLNILSISYLPSIEPEPPPKELPPQTIAQPSKQEHLQA